MYIHGVFIDVNALNRVLHVDFFLYKISAAVHGATEKSLVLVDEFGKGTSSVNVLIYALLWACLIYINRFGCFFEGDKSGP